MARRGQQKIIAIQVAPDILVDGEELTVYALTAAGGVYIHHWVNEKSRWHDLNPICDETIVQRQGDEEEEGEEP
jgi:hypothetical protein